MLGLMKIEGRLRGKTKRKERGKWGKKVKQERERNKER